MKILMVLTQGIGNVIQTIPAYLNLKKIADVDVVYVNEYATDSVKKTDVFPADVKEIDDTWWLRRQSKYDYVFRNWLISQNGSYVMESVDAFREVQSEVQRNLMSITSIGADTEMLRDYRASETALKGDYITVHNGGLNVKEWAMKKYPLFQRVLKDLDCKVVCVGSTEEYIQGTVNRTSMSLRDTAGVIKGSKFHISTDTSTMHIAGLVETPGVGIFTSTDPRKNWDKDFHHTITPVTSDMECAPCQWGYHWSPDSIMCRESRAYHYPCQNVDPERILDAVKKVLANG